MLVKVDDLPPASSPVLLLHALATRLHPLHAYPPANIFQHNVLPHSIPRLSRLYQLLMRVAYVVGTPATSLAPPTYLYSILY